MAQYPLTSERGGVVFELLLIMPLLILMLGAALLVNRTMRAAWVSQAAAREALWAAQRQGQVPTQAGMLDALKPMDGLLSSINLHAVSAGTALDGLDAAVREGVGKLGSIFGVELARERLDSHAGHGDGSVRCRHAGHRP